MRAGELDLELRAGSFALSMRAEWDAPVAALFGPSGSGKSTVLEAVAGLRPAKGRITLRGRVLLDSAAGVEIASRARGLGWVPQDGGLFPHLTAGRNLRFGLGRGGREGARLLEEAVRILEIGPLLDRPVGALSGGERQRVAVARALASGPRMLLLDEPLASIDIPLRARIFAHLVRLRDEVGIPMIYVSHDPQEVLALSGHVVVLEGGRTVAAGDPRDVLWSAAALPVLDAAGFENRLAATLEGPPAEDGTRLARLEGGEGLVVPAFPSPGGSRVTLGFSAEDVLLAAGEPAGLSAQNVLPAHVEEVREAGGRAYVRARARSPFVAKVTRRAVDALGLRPGAPVLVILKAHSIRVWG